MRLPAYDTTWWYKYNGEVMLRHDRDCFIGHHSHPDDERYENTSLHCYQADRRNTIKDELNAMVKVCEEESVHLELRLAGKIF